MTSRSIRCALFVSVCLFFDSPPTRAHKPFRSVYTFHEHIRPIFLAKCGSCHREGGVGPMSLLDYRSAYPWAESIKIHVIDQTMPPWQAEADLAALSHETTLTAVELNRVIDWASGGTPEGRPGGESGSSEPEPLGERDWELRLPQPFTLAEDVGSAIRWFAIAGSAETRLVRAIAPRPQNPGIVRSVSIHADPTGAGARLDREDPEPGFQLDSPDQFPLLVRWLAGQKPIRLPERAAYRFPASTDWLVRIHYAKTWLQEGVAVSDQTAIDLYSAESTRPTHRVVGTEIRLEGSDGTFEASLPRDLEIIAVLPRIDEPVQSWRLDYRRGPGDEEPLLLLNQAREEWLAPYWLENPLNLTEGSTVVVHVGSNPETRTNPSATGVRLETLVPLRADEGPP